MPVWKQVCVLSLALLACPAAASDREELEKAFLACQNRDYPTALWIYDQLAVNGNAEAQFCLGSMYEHGHGVHTSTVYAVKWYTESAEHGFRGAQFRLGCIYAHGEGVPQDYGKAAAWYAKAAEQGDPKAQHLLGTMYEHGQGVPQDKDKAVALYRKSAEQGCPQASLELDRIRAVAAFQEEDYATALPILTKLADQGNAEAQNHLGLMYDFGKGVSQDRRKAIALFTKAAEQGDAAAQFLLGWAYDAGDGVPRDRSQAVAWLTKAAKQGFAEAQATLDRMDADQALLEKAQAAYQRKDYDTASAVFAMLAAKGNPHAQCFLSTMYGLGQGVPMDTDKAVVWCAKAALQGDAEGVAGMGLLYDMNQRLEGCESPDLVKGYALVKCVAKKENERLRRLLEEELKKTRDNMTPAQREEGDALMGKLSR